MYIECMQCRYKLYLIVYIDCVIVYVCTPTMIYKIISVCKAVAKLIRYPLTYQGTIWEYLRHICIGDHVAHMTVKP